MTTEQMRERMLTKIQERFKEFEEEESDLFDAFIKFVRFKNTIELAMSLELITMGEYLKHDTNGDHLFHEKKEKLGKTK